MKILTIFCFFLLIFASIAEDGIGSYRQFQQTRKQLQNVSQNFDLNSLKQLEEKLSKVLDMGKILKMVQGLGGNVQKELGDAGRASPLVANSSAQVANSSAQVANSSAQVAAPLPQVSGQCLNDSQSILQGLLQSKSWAIAMIDALAKPPSGILRGRITWLGNYDQCIAVDAGKFKGQYCLQSFWISSLTNPLTQQPGAQLFAGMCMPDSCSSTDIKNLLNSVVPRASNNTVFALDGTCQEPDQPYDLRAKIVLSVIGIFIALMAIGTLYDVMSRHVSKKEQYSLGEDAIHSTKNGNINIAYISDEKKAEAELKYQMKEVVDSVQIGGKHSSTFEPGIPGRLLLCFSVYTNGGKILNASQGAGTLTAVNGIRFISMTWVILGHTYAFGMQEVGNMGSLFKVIFSRKSFMAIINAEVSVDTFFALSGCLLTYLVLKQLQKGKGNLNWFMFYFHRFWRLTPPYMLVMMVHISLFAYLGSGPAWPKDGHEKDHCEKTWWWNLLYINNFKSGADECFAHAWYLANDMQFFVASPFIIVAMYRSKIAGTIVSGVLLLGTWATTGAVSKHFELHARIEGDYFDEVYQRPYCRWGPYLVGMYTGFLLYRMKCKCNINKYLNIVLWLVFATLACTVLYGVYGEYNGDEMSTDVAALYNAVHRTLWGTAVCWVIFACATGNGGFINTILSWKPFVPLGRLTYCAYLIHPSVQYYYYQSRKQLLYWDDYEIIVTFLGLLGVSYACAFVTSLAFEAPMMGLEKVIFKKEKK